MTKLPRNLFLLSIFFLCSCSNYHLGQPTSPLSQGQTSKSVYVAVIQNDTFGAQLVPLMSQSLRSQLLKNNITLANSPEDADFALHTTLTKYNRDLFSVKNADTLLASSYALNLEAKLDLIDLATNKYLLQKTEASASINALTESGTLNIEYHDLPALTDKLALNINNILLNLW